MISERADAPSAQHLQMVSQAADLKMKLTRLRRLDRDREHDAMVRIRRESNWPLYC